MKVEMGYKLTVKGFVLVRHNLLNLEKVNIEIVHDLNKQKGTSVMLRRIIDY